LNVFLKLTTILEDDTAKSRHPLKKTSEKSRKNLIVIPAFAGMTCRVAGDYFQRHPALKGLKRWATATRQSHHSRRFITQPEPKSFP
jgi:hypothetical protein